MKISDITYKNMVEAIPELFPELKTRFDDYAGTFDRDLGYIYYSGVFFEHIKAMVHSGNIDEELLTRMFAFTEELLKHKDHKVVDVADQSICESIANDELVLQKAQKYMGPKAKKICAAFIADVNRPRQ